MKKLFGNISVVLAFAFAPAGGQAVPITVNMTADNILDDGGLYSTPPARAARAGPPSAP